MKKWVQMGSPGLLTVVVDGLPNASLSFLLSEGAFYVKGFLYPGINIQQSPHVFIMTPANDRGQIPVKHRQRAKIATLQGQRGTLGMSAPA